MANTKSALKELRKAVKRTAHNNDVKENITWLAKQARKSIEAKKDDAKELVAKTEKAVDKAVQKGIMKENTGRRRKSRLMKKFNEAFAAKK